MSFPVPAAPARPFVSAADAVALRGGVSVRISPKHGLLVWAVAKTVGKDVLTLESGAVDARQSGSQHRLYQAVRAAVVGLQDTPDAEVFCDDENAEGREYPSSSSIRNYFGNWTAALRFAQTESDPHSASEHSQPETAAEPQDDTARCPICSHAAWPIVRGLWAPDPDNPEPKVWRAGCMVISDDPKTWHCMNSGCGWEW